MKKFLLVNEAFLIEKANASFLLLDYFSSFGRRPWVFRHETQRNPFRSKSPTGTMKEIHGQFEGNGEFMMLCHAIRIFLRTISIRVHIVPDEMTDERKMLADPFDVKMKMLGVVGIYHSIDIAGYAHIGDMGKALDNNRPRILVLGNEVVDLGSITMQGNMNVLQTAINALAKVILVSQHLTIGYHPMDTNKDVFS